MKKDNWSLHTTLWYIDHIFGFDRLNYVFAEVSDLSKSYKPSHGFQQKKITM